MDISLAGLIKHLSKRLKPGNPKPVKSVHFSLPNEHVSNLKSVEPDQEKKDAIVGVSVSIIIVAFLIIVILWGVALYVVSKNWDNLLPWAKVVGLIGLFPIVPYGPLLTIIVVLAGRKNN